MTEATTRVSGLTGVSVAEKCIGLVQQLLQLLMSGDKGLQEENTQEHAICFQEA